MVTTKTGDGGTTSLFGGKRVKKSSNIVEAYGSVDELSSYIGFVIQKVPEADMKIFLTDIQKDLYMIMSSLSGSPTDIPSILKRVKLFEQKIDKMLLGLPRLNRFILPQGGEISSLFHIVRTVCRRAERNVVKANSKKLHIVQYLNRLSDLLFVLARHYNTKEEVTV